MTVPGQRDAELAVAQAHGLLNKAGVPACDDDGLPLGLPLRIAVLVDERDQLAPVRVPAPDFSRAAHEAMAHPERWAKAARAEQLATGQPRTRGDDVVIQVRVRAANLPALEAGVQLGVDHLTAGAIELRVVARDDGVHELEVVTNQMTMMAAPDPVDAEPST